MRRAVGFTAAWAVGAVLVGTSACAHQDDGARAEVVRLRRELHRVRARVDAYQLRIARLEASMAQAPAPEPALEERASAARAPDAALPVVRLTPDGEALEGESEAPIMIRLRGRESSVAVDRDVLRRPDPLDSKGDAEEAYRTALTALRDAHDPGQAIRRFDAFRRAHPGHALEDNAVYWTGEAYMMLLEHEQALQAFERVLARFPRSNKVPWAKLRAAESHLALGQVAKGRTLLDTVTRDYPSTEPARLAAARLRTLSATRDENRP